MSAQKLTPAQWVVLRNVDNLRRAEFPRCRHYFVTEFTESSTGIPHTVRGSTVDALTDAGLIRADVYNHVNRMTFVLTDAGRDKLEESS